jgi:sensor histidine kinase YesM
MPAKFTSTKPAGDLWTMKNKRIWLHAGFCMAVYVLSYAAISIYINNLNGGMYPVGSAADYAIRVRVAVINDHALSLGTAICSFFLICVYTGRWLCSRWFLQKETVLFLFASLLSILGLTLLGGIFMQFLFHPVNMNLVSFLLNIGPFILLSQATGIFIKLIRDSLKQQMEAAAADSAQKQSKIELLQSQLSPHFLLLRLADLLRYSVYNTKKTFVPLIDELAYIENYLGFEKIGTGDRLVLKTNIDGTKNSRVQIAPMLLIVFIENAFKHSKNTVDEKIQVDIELKLWKDELLFSVGNSYSDSEKEQSRHSGDHSGLGLENTMTRLQLLYAGRYDYRQEKAEGYYSIYLKLKLHSDGH